MCRKPNLHMFYDVPVQRCHKPTSGPMSLDFNPSGRFHSSRSSLPPVVPGGKQQLRAFPSHWKTGCSSNTTADVTTHYKVGCGPSFPKACDVFLKHQGPGWICFSRQRNTESKLFGQQQHFQEVHGRGRVSSGYPGVGSTISTLWQLSTRP